MENYNKNGMAAGVHTDAAKTNNTVNVKGELTYDDKVIQKIVGTAVEQIDGLLTVDGGFFSNIAEKLVNTDNVTAGIETEVGKKQVAVDMDIVVEYGRNSKQTDKAKSAVNRGTNKAQQKIEENREPRVK